MYWENNNLPVYLKWSVASRAFHRANLVKKNSIISIKNVFAIIQFFSYHFEALAEWKLLNWRFHDVYNVNRCWYSRLIKIHSLIKIANKFRYTTPTTACSTPIPDHAAPIPVYWNCENVYHFLSDQHHSVNYTRCELHTVWPTHSVNYTQCELHTVWTTHGVNYTQWELHSVRTTHSVNNT